MSHTNEIKGGPSLCSLFLWIFKQCSEGSVNVLQGQDRGLSLHWSV